MARVRSVKKNRMWKVGVFFFIFSCYNVYSAARIGDPSTPSSMYDSSIETDYATTMPTTYTTTDKNENEQSIETSTKPTHYHGHPTWRPRRENCTPPAIEQFPRPLMSPNVRKHGGLIIHVIVAIFSFLGLAVVCDDYFVSSLDRICEELKLSPDVAGATFMAAGSSAPELATVIIGVFFAKDDIGVSGVIGSAVFNIMFVISVCALLTGTTAQLNYWPLVRDCTFYSISIVVMLIVISNEIISWPEALMMMCFYVLYCIALHFNTALEKWAQQYIVKLPIKLPTREEQSALVTYKNIPESSYVSGGQQPKSQSPDNTQIVSETDKQQQQPDMQTNTTDYTSWDPNAAWGDDNNQPVVSSTTTTNQPASYNQGYDSWGNNDPYAGTQNYGYNLNDDSEQRQQVADVNNSVDNNVEQTPAQNQEYYKSKDVKTQEELPNPLEKPTDGGVLAQISWGIVFPIHYMCRRTMVDVRQEKYKKWYPLTFLISMMWISFYSYFMVWMITIIGSTLGIPDTVMGLTFVAAGVSVPDALSSIAVLKEGLGDMAVSNAVGSNVFDILICLGLPWFIQTAIIKPGSHVNVISKGLTYSTLSLLSTVFFLLFATHMNGWKLDRKLGVVLMLWYLLFIIMASLYELNIFGQLNPPECPSAY